MYIWEIELEEDRKDDKLTDNLFAHITFATDTGEVLTELASQHLLPWCAPSLPTMNNLLSCLEFGLQVVNPCPDHSLHGTQMQQA